MKRQTFQDRLTEFSIRIVTLCNELRRDRNLLPIADQLIRSGTSIGANITEAKAASSRREYTHFFQIALKSANETLYWLQLSSASAPNLNSKIEALQEEATEIVKILSSSILTLKQSSKINLNA